MLVVYSHPCVDVLCRHGPTYITDNGVHFVVALRTKLHDQGVVDIQVLYIMLAALPFGLAVPEAVLQVGNIHLPLVMQYFGSRSKSNYETCTTTTQERSALLSFSMYVCMLC